VPERDREQWAGEERESEGGRAPCSPLGRIRTSTGHGRPGSVARDARRSRPPLAASALSWWAAGVAAAAAEEEDAVVVGGVLSGGRGGGRGCLQMCFGGNVQKPNFVFLF
jgi:hypothetical protein